MPSLATMVILSVSLATAHRWPHSLLPRAPGKVPGRHVGGCAGARVQSGSLPRQAPCRGRCLVAPGSLSLAGPCRDAWRVAASSLRCLGWPSRQAPLAGALYLSSLAGQDAPCREGSLSLACRCSACRRRWILFSVIAYSRGPCPAVSVALVFATPTVAGRSYVSRGDF